MSKTKIPHIMVDAFPMVDDHFSGIGRYTVGIVKGLDELAGEGKLTYSLIVPRHWIDRIYKYRLQNYKKIIRSPIPNRIMRGFMKHHWRIPSNLFLGRGIYYFPSFLAWPMWGAKSSVVVHDVTYLATPECVSEGNRKYLTQTVPFSLENSHNVISVSNFSKTEIMKYYNYPEDKIFVATPSINRRHFYKRSEEEIRRVRLKYDIYEEDYIFSVGNIEPRKNYVRLIQAYTKLPLKIASKYPLVIVGAGAWDDEEIREQIQEAKEQGYKIINPGRYVPDDDMPALYSGAKFFAFVPIYEGFGMSPLEAYACKTPVLASNIASVPEAAGDAAAYCDPLNVDDILDKLQFMIRETERDRSQWNKKMEKRLKSLTWRKSAEITAAALTDLPVEHFQKGGKK